MTMRLQSGLNATPKTGPVNPLMVSKLFPVPASHTLTVWSKLALPLTMRLPSELIATHKTEAVCPLRVSRFLPVPASHTFTVQSSLPLTMRLPSGLIATLRTISVCPLKVEGSLSGRGKGTGTEITVTPARPTRSAGRNRIGRLFNDQNPPERLHILPSSARQCHPDQMAGQDSPVSPFGMLAVHRVG